MLLFLDSCKSKDTYLRTTECLNCSNKNLSSNDNSPYNQRKAEKLIGLTKPIKTFIKKSNSTSTLSNSSKLTTSRSVSKLQVSKIGPDMQNLPLSTNQFLSTNQLNYHQSINSSTYPPQQNYNQMNIQNSSPNFKYPPDQQYMNYDESQLNSQMTNYILSNNVYNLNLNSPNSLNNAFNNSYNYQQSNQFQNLNNSLIPGPSYLKNLNSDQFNNGPSPTLSPILSSPPKSSKNKLDDKIDNLKELKTFNFQNRTHIHGHQNNFEPNYQFQNKDDFKSDNEFSDYEDDKTKNKFLSSFQNKLPVSNVDLSTANFSNAAPRTGAASPISSYNSPTVVESRNKKKKFNFKMKKFKIKGKKSSTKQSKKSNKSQKSKIKPGLLYSQLNKGIESGTLNSINKMQLSILNTGLIPIESEKASAIIAKEPFDLSTNKFIDHLELLRKYNVLFKIEYFVACKLKIIPLKHALKPENEIKNCNKKLLPYDYNRVVLETIEGIPGSDYINASHVDVINIY